jgi:hypothetical protein
MTKNQLQAKVWKSENMLKAPVTQQHSAAGLTDHSRPAG